MQELNKYGFVSGGYIFDWLDRGCLDFINKKFPDTANENWFTYDGEITYNKQLCNLDDALATYTINSYDDNAIDCYAIITQNAIKVVEAWFTFKKAKHNYCETKRGNKMSELKCPFCQQELRCDNTWNEVYMCRNPNCKHLLGFGTKELWQELITTRKALDKAKWWLNEIVENHRFTPISTAEKALEQINEITKGNK